jgi:hypothetical protein
MIPEAEGLSRAASPRMVKKRVFKNFWPLHDGAFWKAAGQNHAWFAGLCELSKNPVPFLSSL